ncbi:MAG TPA: PIN domain-containing protein [Chloroflexota bacterium]|nr:PIN domain-containing protein [Chloroflexota bacterium]
MATAFIDTNIFLRYLIQPGPTEPQLAAQTQQAQAIIQQLDSGALSAATCEGVIIEVVWVLTSKTLYNVPRDEVQRLLSPLLRLKGLSLANKRTYLQALDLFTQYQFLDFVDALNVAHMRRLGLREILSFDRDFDRVPEVERRVQR